MRGSVFIYDYVHKLYYDCNEYHLELVLTLTDTVWHAMVCDVYFLFSKIL